MEKLQLKNITLIIIDCINLERAQIALDICQKDIDFGDVKLLTNFEDEKDKRIIKIEKIDSVKKYSYFCIKELNNYVDTEYCLLIQYDGFILNPLKWKEEFLNYDYIGPRDLKRSNEENELVMNGGFTLRSKKLLKELQNIDNDTLEKELNFGEDYIIFKHTQELENKNIIFPNINVVNEFAIDTTYKKTASKSIESFGFHGLLIDLKFFLEQNPEFENINKYFDNNLHYIKNTYSNILKIGYKIPFFHKILLFFKKVYYKYFY